MELINYIGRLNSLIDYLIYWSLESQVQKSPNRLCKTLLVGVLKKIYFPTRLENKTTEAYGTGSLKFSKHF